jgi:hypothetical protein
MHVHKEQASDQELYLRTIEYSQKLELQAEEKRRQKRSRGKGIRLGTTVSKIMFLVVSRLLNNASSSLA